jgi:N-acyl-D-aspartate/D-glutamate deacylase
MEYDLLIKGGLTVDGSGLPGYRADVGIKDQKIVGLGRLKGGAARTINADGLVVAPGFIDQHTHMDAQILWDPYATCEPQHGFTSIVIGNCGLTLAPVKSGDEDALVKSFVRVEAIPRFALEQGVPWGWHSYGDYLGALEDKIGVNVGGLVGHIAVRQYVLGEEAVERQATAKEMEQMRALVVQAIQSGALGFSTNRNERHLREDGKPVPSCLASEEELLALCDEVGESNCGVIQIIMGGSRTDNARVRANRKFYELLAQRTQRPVMWGGVVQRGAEPDLWKEQLDAVASAFRQGYRTYGAAHTIPGGRHFTLKNAQVFDEFPSWKSVMFLDEDERKQAFVDPEVRQRLKADLADPRPTNFHRRWDIIQIEKVVNVENQKYVGKSVAEMAAMRQQEAVDAFLDLSLEEDLGTLFWSASTGGDPVAMGEILRSPYLLVGNSDAGAHVQHTAHFGYSTTLLGHWVRERKVLSLEQAIHKLTFLVASVYGLEGRGLLRPGYSADLVIFNPDTVQACEPEWASDYPAGTKRMIQKSLGVHWTIVNGRVVYEEGRLSGDLPGKVLRNGACGS